MTISIDQAGTVEVISSGGGIYLAIMPVTIENKKVFLVYDSESFFNDSKNIVEFTVYDQELIEIEKQFFDNGIYIESKKRSPYKKLFSKLASALKKELKQHSFLH